MVDVQHDDVLMMKDEIDYADDVSNVNVQSFDELTMDHHNIHSENEVNNPIQVKFQRLSRENNRKKRYAKN